MRGTAVHSRGMGLFNCWIVVHVGQLHLHHQDRDLRHYFVRTTLIHTCTCNTSKVRTYVATSTLTVVQTLFLTRTVHVHVLDRFGSGLAS